MPNCIDLSTQKSHNISNQLHRVKPKWLLCHSAEDQSAFRKACSSVIRAGLHTPWLNPSQACSQVGSNLPVPAESFGRADLSCFWLGNRGHESDENPKRLTYLGFVRLRRKRSNPYSMEPSAETRSKNPAFHEHIPNSEPTEGNMGVTCTTEANLHFKGCISDLGTELKAIQNLNHEFCMFFARRVEWRLPYKPAAGEGGKRKQRDHIKRFWYKHHKSQLIIKSYQKDCENEEIYIKKMSSADG